MAKKVISDELRAEVEAIIAQYNEDTYKKAKKNVYYFAAFKGKFLYLNRQEYHLLNPICRLAYQPDTQSWDFAVYKWSKDAYDPNEFFFPGSGLANGTVLGAMKAGDEAYPPRFLSSIQLQSTSFFEKVKRLWKRFFFLS